MIRQDGGKAWGCREGGGEGGGWPGHAHTMVTQTMCVCQSDVMMYDVWMQVHQCDMPHVCQEQTGAGWGLGEEGGHGTT